MREITILHNMIRFSQIPHVFPVFMTLSGLPSVKELINRNRQENGYVIICS